jgi:Peptidase inhibitor family I36
MERFTCRYVLGLAVASIVAGCGGGSNGGAPAAAPAAPPAATVCATFYADANLKGATLVSMGPADNSQTVPATFNDVMSSVAVSPGCTVMAYADGNYGGQVVTFTQTTEIVPASMNDQMSSYKCTCGGGDSK